MSEDSKSSSPYVVVVKNVAFLVAGETIMRSGRKFNLGRWVWGAYVRRRADVEEKCKKERVRG